MPKESPTATRDNIISWVANPLFNLTFPLAASILDCFRRPDLTIAHKYIKRPALLGASIGASAGILLCSPIGRLMNEIGSHLDWHTDFDKLSDSFHQIHNTQGFAKGDHLSNFWNVFLCMMIIAATTIAVKSLFAMHGMHKFKQEYANPSTDQPSSSQKSNFSEKSTVAMGLSYGFFGDSGQCLSGARAFFKALHEVCCRDTRSEFGPENDYQWENVPVIEKYLEHCEKEQEADNLTLLSEKDNDEKEKNNQHAGEYTHYT